MSILTAQEIVDIL